MPSTGTNDVMSPPDLSTSTVSESSDELDAVLTKDVLEQEAMEAERRRKSEEAAKLARAREFRCATRNV